MPDHRNLGEKSVPFYSQERKRGVNARLPTLIKRYTPGKACHQPAEARLLLSAVPVDSRATPDIVESVKVWSGAEAAATCAWSCGLISENNNKTNLGESLRANLPDLDSNVSHLPACDVLWKVSIPIWIIPQMFCLLPLIEAPFYTPARCSHTFPFRAPGSFVVSLMRARVTSS